MKQERPCKTSGLRRPWRAIFTALLLVLAASGASAEAQPRALFGEVPGVAAERAGDRPTDKRKRRVNIDLSALADLRFPEGAASVGLNLFPDVELTAVKSRFERRGDRGFTWFGTVQGDPQSAVVLTTGNGLLQGLVSVNGRHFAIRGASTSTQEVSEIDQSAFPPEGCDLVAAGDQAPLEPPLASTPDILGDSGATIDVLVAYTPAARADASPSDPTNPAAIQLLAQNAVDATNFSYANSSVVPRLNLVHAAEVSYTESADNFSGWVQDLDRLAGSGDGYLDSVHTLRDTYRADVVVLLVRDSTQYCGLADAIMANAATAFSLVAQGCATGNLSFPHEIGHLQGARHDLYVDPTLGSPYDYNHGHINLSIRKRTVMAYNNQCNDTWPYTYCDRLPYWSNPAVNYPSTGSPTGTASRQNNALVLNNTAATVANFRQGTRTLTVQSIYPATGVTITVSPLDAGGLGSGSTTFTRTYTLGTAVTLTAPVTADGNPLSSWTNCPSVSGPSGEYCTLLLDDDRVITVNYDRDTTTRPVASALWSRGDTGQTFLWELDPSTGVLQRYNWISTAGVGSSWLATSYKRVSDTEGYVLWSNSVSGQCTLWKINPATGGLISYVFVSLTGVGANWQASSFDYVNASTGYVLWSNGVTGQTTLWQINPATGGLNSWAFISQTGVGANWFASSLDYVSPTMAYVLWTNSSTGQSTLWQVNPATGGLTSWAFVSQTGVGPSWQTSSFDYVTAGTGTVLWTNGATGQATRWTVDPATGAISGWAWVSSPAGLGGPWLISSYGL